MINKRYGNLQYLPPFKDASQPPTHIIILFLGGGEGRGVGAGYYKVVTQKL